MIFRRNRTHTALAAGATTLGMVVLSACGAADTGSSDYDKITLVVPPWVGAEANVVVAQYVMETELDLDVSTKQMSETVAFDALNSGKAEALLEDWGGAPKKIKTYVEEKKTVVDGGSLGVVGHIGWYVPKYFADEHPDVLDWKNLNKYAKDFESQETPGKGTLLQGDPSYTSYDESIIKNLKLNFKTHSLGAESTQITEFRKNFKTKTPFISYWWQPQWLNAELDLVEVKLPPYKEGCQDDPKTVACAYPDTDLKKFLNADFAEKGGDAAEFLKNFKWTTEDQNAVAKMITKDQMSPEDAAKKWVEANKDKVDGWLPK